MNDFLSIEFPGYVPLEVQLKKPDDFLKVRETLTRIGIASKRENILYQSCHILHKQGRYFIVHFKELFALDGKHTDLSDGDLQRRNTIAKLLADWELLVILDPDRFLDLTPINQIKIIAHKNKHEWQLESKYSIGNTHK